MENITITLLLIACLLVGGTFTYLLFPQEVEVKVPVNVEVVKEVPVEVVKTIEVQVGKDYIGSAIAEVFKQEGDDEDFLTCDGYEYDEDEVTLRKVREWSVSNEGDDYTTAFTAQFKYDDNSDERACKQDLTYEVFYEDGEKPEVD